VQGRALAEQDERSLISELARRAVETAAPEELVLFAETADDFFRDPEASVRMDAREEAVGFGLELAMLTPYVLAAATAVVELLAAVVQESVKEEAKAPITQLLRRLLGRARAAPNEVAPLTDAQRRKVRDTAYGRARDLGLDEGRAHVLADAIVGGLALG
jgi:hypothetical protein